MDSLKISVCIDMMFSKVDFYERFSKVKNAGINAVEFWKWSNKDINRVKYELQKSELDLSIFNLDSKNELLSQDLMRGILNQARKEEFMYAVTESIPIYKSLKASGMIVLIGETTDESYETQIGNIIQNLLYVKPLLESENITLLLEPLNNVDRKNYFLPRCKEVLDIIKLVNSPNVKLLFDIYHEQLMNGNIIDTIIKNETFIGHFHIADVPGRHEPGTGEINYKNVLSTIRNINYKKFVGLEYRATKDDEKTLSFINNTDIRG